MPAATVSPLEVTVGIVLFWLAIGLLGILRPKRPDAITRIVYPLGAIAGVALAVVGLVAIALPWKGMVLPQIGRAHV